MVYLFFLMYSYFGLSERCFYALPLKASTVHFSHWLTWFCGILCLHNWENKHLNAWTGKLQVRLLMSVHFPAQHLLSSLREESERSCCPFVLLTLYRCCSLICITVTSSIEIQCRCQGGTVWPSAVVQSRMPYDTIKKYKVLDLVLTKGATNTKFLMK